MIRCPSCFRPSDAAHGNGTCPRCTYPLPEGWHDSQVTCIAMAGARATGKSVYLGVLKPQLEQLVLAQHGVLRFADSVSQQSYEENYQRPLFEQRGMMAPTPSMMTRTPIVLRIDPTGGPRHHLVIRDVAGEDLERVADPARLDFFAYADAVVFLFDPFCVDEVREKLGLQARASSARPEDVLDSVFRLIGDGRPKIAVTLSKFDALQTLGNAADAGWEQIMRNPGAAFFRDPGLGGDYDEKDGELLHQEVRSLLLRLGARGIVNRTQPIADADAQRLRYFVVSALGDAPQGEHVHPRGIAPFRCTDPVRWTYNGSGVL